MATNVTIAEVRNKLGSLPSNLVADGIITQNINEASRYVDAEKATGASTLLVDDATRTFAAYKTLVSYAAYVERAEGEVPGMILAQLNELKNEIATLMPSISRGVRTRVNPQAEITKSLVDWSG